MMKFFRRLWEKRSTQSSAIGIIGGADGPTAVFMSSKKSDREWDGFLREAQQKIKPCAHPFAEIGAYLEKKHHALPHTLSPQEETALKTNVILNNFPQVLTHPAPLPQSPGKKDLLRYARENSTIDQARSYPAEKLGLEMKAFSIDADNLVFLEMTSEYLQFAGEESGEAVHDDLILWLGVTQQDIDTLSPRFQSYARTLQKLNRI